jgi:chromosome segregation ATPase
MIETIKDHWAFIVVLGSGLIWIGRVKTALDEICQRLRDHSKAIDALRKDYSGLQLKTDCAVVQGHCQADIHRAFDEYRLIFSKDIQEIKQLIQLMDQKREESRRELSELFQVLDDKREQGQRELHQYFDQILRQGGYGRSVG